MSSVYSEQHNEELYNSCLYIVREIKSWKPKLAARCKYMSHVTKAYAIKIDRHKEKSSLEIKM